MSGHEQLKVLPCPSCGKVGTLDLCTRMVALPVRALPVVADPLLGGPLRALTQQALVLVCTSPSCRFVRPATSAGQVSPEYLRPL